MNFQKTPTPPHYGREPVQDLIYASPNIISEPKGCKITPNPHPVPSDGIILDKIDLSTDNQTASPKNLALIIGQGVSCAKLRLMAKTGVDAQLPQQFALQAYRYNYRGDRISYTSGHGCLIWIKIRSLGLLPQGVYVHGEICKARAGATQTADGLYGGFMSRHRKHRVAQLLRPGTVIQFVHRGALADGPVYHLYDPATREEYTPYIPADLDCNESDRSALLSNMIPLSSFAAQAATNRG